MKLVASVIALSLLSGAAMAAGEQTNMAVGATPAATFTVSNYYKQDVYDRADNKIGTVDDVLIDKSGKITQLIIGVGGFLGVGEKDVSAQFQQVQMKKKDNKWYLVMDANKDNLKAAQGLKYDRDTTTWVADNSDRNTNRK